MSSTLHTTVQGVVSLHCMDWKTTSSSESSAVRVFKNVYKFKAKPTALTAVHTIGQYSKEHPYLSWGGHQQNCHLHDQGKQGIHTESKACLWCFSGGCVLQDHTVNAHRHLPALPPHELNHRPCLWAFFLFWKEPIEFNPLWLNRIKAICTSCKRKPTDILTTQVLMQWNVLYVINWLYYMLTAILFKSDTNGSLCGWIHICGLKWVWVMNVECITACMGLQCTHNFQWP